SRRRHTRSKRDWSSDVCSSDLYPFLDEDDMEMRLSRTLDRLGYSNTMDTPTAISIDSEASAFMAMVCTTWALAQNTPGITPTMRSEERRVGKEGRRGGGQWPHT